MKAKRRIVSILIVVAMLCSVMVLGGWSKAEKPFPNKPITLIVPTGAGGGSDTVARKIAALAEPKLGQPINVVNVVGGGGVVGWEQVKASDPDGYTIMLAFGELNTNPHMQDISITYEDFQPLILLNKSPSVLTVRTDSGWNSIEDFIAYAKDHPGEVRVGTAGAATVWAIGAGAIEKGCDVDLTLVSAETSAESQAALLGGHIEALTISDGEVSQYVKSGEFQIIGVLDDRRLEGFPDVPTFAEAGYEDVTSFTWRGLSLPQGVPEDVVNKLYEVFAECAASDEFKTFMTEMNYPMLVLDPAEFGTSLAEWDVYFEGMINELGMGK